MPIRIFGNQYDFSPSFLLPSRRIEKSVLAQLLQIILDKIERVALFSLEQAFRDGGQFSSEV